MQGYDSIHSDWSRIVLLAQPIEERIYHDAVQFLLLASNTPALFHLRDSSSSGCIYAWDAMHVCLFFRLFAK